MPDYIIVNVPPYEGEYEFDLEGRLLNTDEWEVIHKVSGYLPLTFEEGWRGGDPRLFVSFAVIAMERAGKIQADEVLHVADLLKKAPVDGSSIQFRGDPQEEEDPQSGSATDASTPSSGDDSSESSEPSPESSTLPVSGIQDWATGSDSDHLTLAK